MPSRNPVYDDFYAALRVQDELTPKWETLETDHYSVHVLIIPDDASRKTGSGLRCFSNHRSGSAARRRNERK
jgi:hypothetical protein